MKIPHIFQLHDFQSLQANHLEPLTKQIWRRSSVECAAGKYEVLSLDENGGEVLLNIEADGKQSCFLLKQEYELPPNPLTWWQASNPWVFSNPTETDISKLFPTWEIDCEAPFPRTLPQVVPGENADSPNVSSTLGRLTEDPERLNATGSALLGHLALYQCDHLKEPVIALFIITNLESPENGLLHFFRGREIQTITDIRE